MWRSFWKRRRSDEKERFQSDRVLAYFRLEWKVLVLITLSGLIYNLGLLAGPGLKEK